MAKSPSVVVVVAMYSACISVSVDAHALWCASGGHTTTFNSGLSPSTFV